MDTPPASDDLPAPLRALLTMSGVSNGQALLQEFLSVQDSIELMALIRRAPFLLGDEFMFAVEEWAMELVAQGEPELAEGLRQRLDGLRQIDEQVQMREAAAESPVMQAVLAFLQAEDDAAARGIFQQRRDLLMFHEAQQLLDQLEGGDPESQERIESRQLLLRHLRQGTPPPDALLSVAAQQEPERGGTNGTAWSTLEEGEREGAAENPLLDPLLTFLNARSPDEMQQVLTDFPDLLGEGVDPLFERILTHYQDDAEATTLLKEKKALLDLCRAQGAEALFAMLAPTPELMERAGRFREALDAYLALYKMASEGQGDAATWQQVVSAGEELLSPSLADIPGVDLVALRANLASAYNRFGTAQNQMGNLPVALAAFERAAALQPDFPMWHRNVAATLIGMGQLDAAETALGRARALEPTAARLAALDAELAAARRAQ